MTGVATERPHSLPFPFVMARLPGTTTAPAGMMSGVSAVARWISPVTRS